MAKDPGRKLKRPKTRKPDETILGERKGTLKDVQKQLRHARPDTTLENYVKEIPDSVYLMVDAMYERIAGLDRPQLLAALTVGGVQ